jgi:glycosyltransferase involved in cell wall biosynthesis
MSLRVCIVSLNAYPAVDPASGAAVGGIETGAWTIARGLAAQSDIDVHFVVRHTTSIQNRMVNGVHIEPIVERLRHVRRSVSEAIEASGRFPGFRIRRWSPALIWQLPVLALARPFHRRRPLEETLASLLNQIDADVYLTLGNSGVSALVMQAAAHRDRQGVLWFQANTDIEDAVFAAHLPTDDTLNEYGESRAALRNAVDHASTLIAQTQRQHDQVLKHAGRQATIIRNPIDLNRWDTTPRAASRDHGNGSTGQGGTVLWIGRFDRLHKRPHLCLDVARRCPEVDFTLVINRGDPDVENEIRNSHPTNVRLVDYVPRDQMPRWIREAGLFLSTGNPDFEGFPNVLLEAAASGTPIASLDDFDGFIDRSGCGETADGDVADLAEIVRMLLSDRLKWDQCSQRGQEFVRSQHSVDRIIQNLRGVLTGKPRHRDPQDS